MAACFCGVKQMTNLVLKTVFLPSREDDDCAGDESVTDPVLRFLERAQLDALHMNVWEEPIAPPARTPQLAKCGLEERHHDGIEIEKCGKQTWTYFYKHGVLLKSKVHDPELPSSPYLYFDRKGNEITQGAYQAVA
jgi:hypothetical protein